MSRTVSVVIPSFNHEAFIGQAIDSALAADGVEIEVVVVDDGSTDSSRERLEAYREDQRVRVYLQENRGAHEALNRGLELARGEILAILNSDDVFDPHRLSILARQLDDNPDSALTASWLRVVDADGAELGIKQAWLTLPPWPPGPGPLLSGLGDPRLALLETNWISTTSNLVFPRTLFRDHGLRFLPLRYAHDWDFILSACHLGALELVEQPLVDYRAHGANTIGEGAETGQAIMRFEIMWVVARHAMRLIRASAATEAELVHLRNLLWSSAPTFGCDSLFDQLLLLRGNEDASPTAYDALLEPDHPYRAWALTTLEKSSCEGS